MVEHSDDGRRARLASTMRALLRHRETTTICPSDAARVVGGEEWRDLMSAAREVATELHDAGEVEVQQRGERVEPQSARGPIRLAAGTGLTR